MLCGGGTEREAEELDALTAFCPGADLEVTVLDIPDGRAPAHWERIKNHLSEFRRILRPRRWCSVRNAATRIKIIGCSPNCCRRSFVIISYLATRSSSGRPTLRARRSIIPSKVDVAEEKSRLLHKHYPSQSAATGSTSKRFSGLSRLRGVQCRNSYAEAFIVDKATVTFERR